MENPTHYALPIQMLRFLIGYLSDRPYSEVHEALALLAQLRPLSAEMVAVLAVQPEDTKTTPSLVTDQKGEGG